MKPKTTNVLSVFTSYETNERGDDNAVMDRTYKECYVNCRESIVNDPLTDANLTRALVYDMEIVIQ
ncbi:hypothetical protein DPMN_002280 [Dreissena polymorpha]|uniref:Uncharacterized protein n=1 Tax=Dreissena polymorpha TaxID=45954 RepID=A0A9D4MLZ4_DREPO|nr:hypothetical protein DPMN_002049 [Dreissena polymorpha]KAH3878389.1 hypothetical protein DPMN_002280 [Dreissena polymorpha]